MSAVKITKPDVALLSEHIGQLRQLARNHDDYAESLGTMPASSLSKSAAIASAKRVKRLANLIENLAGLKK